MPRPPLSEASNAKNVRSFETTANSFMQKEEMQTRKKYCASGSTRSTLVHINCHPVTPTLVDFYGCYVSCRKIWWPGRSGMDRQTGTTFCNSKASQQYESRLNTPLSFPSIWLLTHMHHAVKVGARSYFRAMAKGFAGDHLAGSCFAKVRSTACLNMNDRHLHNEMILA